MRCIKILYWTFLSIVRVNSTSCFITSQEKEGTWIFVVHFFVLFWKRYAKPESYILTLKYNITKLIFYVLIKYIKGVLWKIKSLYICKSLLIWEVIIWSVKKRMIVSPAHEPPAPPSFCLRASEVHRCAVTSTQPGT